MSGPDLKPCPFCDHGAEFVEAQGYPMSGWRVHCDYCGAWADGKQWNRRAPVDYAALPEVQAMIVGAWCDGRDAAATASFRVKPLSLNQLEAIGGLAPAAAIAARDAMIAEAVAKEREACAELAASSTVPSQTAMRLSAAIRKRGEC